MLTRFSICLLLTSSSLAAFSGCGSDSDPRSYHVKGSVTYQGKPVPAGSIQFVPAKGNSGPPGSAKIVDGKYDTSAEGSNGTVGGKHTVIVTGYDGKADPDAELPLGKQLFNEYKTELDIPKQDEPATKDIDVVIHKV